MGQSNASVSIATQSCEISVIVPVMNEQGNIRPLIDEICEALAGRDYEIIYVDDGSDDGSAAELAEAAAQIAQLRVLRHQVRAGQSAAIRSGLLRARGQLICVLDGDGQNVPSDLPDLISQLEAIRPATGMAGGVRTKRKDSFMRLQASLLARYIRKTLLRDSHPDSGCGIKVVDRDIFLQLPFFNHMHRFMPSLVRRAGGTVLAVPVSHRARGAGASKYTNLNRALVGIIDILGVIWLLGRADKSVSVQDLTDTITSSAKPKAKQVTKSGAKKAVKKPAKKGMKKAAAKKRTTS
ncbi:MAG: glycosyltransferase family 2 protein [Candidatus Puniceispirillaceae bacterium]